MRPLNARICLDNLRHNYQTLKQIYDGKILAVIKVDAYGHDAVRCVHALPDPADGFVVATVDEAAELRESGTTSPIVLLGDVFEASEYATADKYNLQSGVGSQQQLEALIAHNWQTPVKVWLKMDSGMHRAGFFPHDYISAYTTLKQYKHVGGIVKFSHFVCAGEPDNGMAEMQLEASDLTCKGLEGGESLTNFAVILNVPEARRDWGRAGLALYDISPSGSVDERLKPVMHLASRVFGERVLQPYPPIGYGAMFYTSKPTRVSLIAYGYVDGYSRRASTSSPVAVEDKRSRIIGRVSMDMITVESDASQEGSGAEVELRGDIVNISEVAEVTGMISYEILCNVKRAKFTYSE